MRTPSEEGYTQKNHQKERIGKKGFKKRAKNNSVVFLKDFIAREGMSLSDRLWAQIEKTIETN
ncbi:hypothetical protein DSCA_05920 [Desulfosarcina alkanivorans]|uniref:Uncharacterized protein n=1 Tax=Desulfosarcina alkanivorans TaxID=571177 RepID=A0A5K7YB79_9BACT|nr:hypothetical protein [Desulfosarcina alkanivorans]BBO66662.1 hypothetical protein DSCA_05920 [Desulfosarcina alkanivorans]